MVLQQMWKIIAKFILYQKCLFWTVFSKIKKMNLGKKHQLKASKNEISRTASLEAIKNRANRTDKVIDIPQNVIFKFGLISKGIQYIFNIWKWIDSEK